MSYIYVARGENRGEYESYTLGAYATLKEARARLKVARDEEGLGILWVDKIQIGKDVFISNR